MQAAMSSQQNQRRQLCQTVDHISNLPDMIISHILSFMPTKSAVSTSILSKRWKYLWTKAPVLDFTEMPHSVDKIYPQLTLQQKSNFKSFIDRVLLHNDVTYVQRVQLLLYGENYDFYIKSWLRLLARREICEIFIRLSIFLSKPIELPNDFLTREKLVVLKLVGQFAISETMSVHLPNLKTMYLIFVRLPGNEFMRNLLSCCPKLEMLTLSDCDGLTMTNLFVESVSLKRFDLIIPDELSIVINAPNLRCFTIIGMIPSIIGDLSSVVEATINYDELKCDAKALVRLLSGVETLGLGTEVDFSLDEKPPIFSKLIHLRIKDEGNMYMLLNSSPNLKFLTCAMVFGKNCRFESKPPLKCMCSLEKVEICYFYYDSKEFSLETLAYFLKYGLVLKELNIYRVDKNQQDANEIYRKLLMLPRSSVACQIKIEEIF